MKNQLESGLPYFYLSRYIDSICEKFKIDHYTVNEDGSVDVDGDVEITNKGLKKIPLKFGRVTGHFWCGKNELTTLEGAPSEVGGHFNCPFNNLITLEGAPNKVGGNFNCAGNQLTTLEGAPSEVGHFNCYGNQIETLNGSPNKVYGDVNVSNNKLITLEGGPRDIEGNLYCRDNPIWEVYKLFSDWKSHMYSLDYNYLRGDSIVKFRFQESLDDLGIKIPESIKGYTYI